MLHKHQTTKPQNKGAEIHRRHLSDNEQNPAEICRLILDELLLDGNAKQNLATFCQTWAEPEVHELMNAALNKNMVDRDEYPQTAEIEKRCVHMLAHLWNAEEDAAGTSTVGSSEAAMLGGLALLWNWRTKQEAAGKSTAKPNLVTGPVQICWHKFARYWDVDIRETTMDGDRYVMNGEEAAKRCDENTIGVVTTMGTTFTGQYEPVAEIAAALDALQKDTGTDIPMHVDGASGGFVAPFIDADVQWDFRLPRIKSINASGHKFGLSPLGVGWVLWRDRASLPDKLIFHVNYLGGDMPDFALNFSRPGGQVIAQYYNFLRLGKAGYARIHGNCRDIAVFLASEIQKMGCFDIISDGTNGIPALSWKLKPNANFDLHQLEERLRMRGWQVPVYSLPKNLDAVFIQRILVRRGFSRDMAELLLADFRCEVDFLTNSDGGTVQKHPGFNHL